VTEFESELSLDCAFAPSGTDISNFAAEVKYVLTEKISPSEDFSTGEVPHVSGRSLKSFAPLGFDPIFRRAHVPFAKLRHDEIPRRRRARTPRHH